MLHDLCWCQTSYWVPVISKESCTWVQLSLDMAQDLLCCSRNCQPRWNFTAPEETRGATGTLPQVALLFYGVSSPANGMLELAMLNMSFINSCYGNWQIFINNLKKSPLPLGFAAAALEHGVFLLTRFPNSGMLLGSWVWWVQHSQVGYPAIASSFLVTCYK